jgi:hypothetical protein
VLQFKPPLPPRPESELESPAEDEWLFDSNREYLDQIRAYKARKGDENGREDES